jgi:hypothetical protein
LVTGAKLGVDKGKIVLRVKYSLLNYWLIFPVFYDCPYTCKHSQIFFAQAAQFICSSVHCARFLCCF